MHVDIATDMTLLRQAMELRIHVFGGEYGYGRDKEVDAYVHAVLTRLGSITSPSRWSCDTVKTSYGASCV